MDPGEIERNLPATGTEPLPLARRAYGRGLWDEAHVQFTIADRQGLLTADDLWSLGVTAAMVGRDEEFFRVLERSFDARLENGETHKAVRCAFWLGMRSLQVGEISRGGGWLARAQRLLAREQLDSVERGYLLLPTGERLYVQGDYDSAFATAAEAVELAERFGDDELLSLALHIQGRTRIKQARVAEGLELLDEAMLTASTAELFPPVTGVVYCGVIAACRSVYDLRRAQEWTSTLSEWCDRQRGMVAFAGRCLVHRSEIFQLHGDWQASLNEARRASDLFADEGEGTAEGTGPALYQQGELLRLMGDFGAAEVAYGRALEFGHEPQPGLALLRLAQGESGAARAALSRALGETVEPLKRTRLLPALIECLLAAGDTAAAEESCRELAETAHTFGSGVLATLAAQSQGAIELERGQYDAAVISLRRAWRDWQKFDAPFEVAAVRVLLGRACRELGDEDTSRLEFEAARKAFAELGARVDRERVEALQAQGTTADVHGLSERELEVLRLVARGDSNKAIAGRLELSERTVHRHVSNIFLKIEVSSRAAATAFAYEHELI